MLRIAGIILMALVSVQALGQEDESAERRGFRSPEAGGPKSSFRQKRGPEGGGPAGPLSGLREKRDGDKKDETMMLGKALRHPHFAGELGLSEEQRKVIDERVTALEKRHGELRAEMEQAALKQARLMVEKDLDEGALMAAVEETGRIHTEMAKQRIRHLLFMRKTLTPEQVEKARSVIRERMKHHRGEGSRPDGRWRSEGMRGQGQGQGQGQGRWRPGQSQRATPSAEQAQ